MRSVRDVRLIVLVAVLGTLAAMAAPALGAPSTQDNLLTNPGFEGGGYDPIGNGSSVPNGWRPWWETPESGCYGFRPFYQIINTAGRVHSGTYALQYYTDYTSHNAGVYQRVNATPGTTYRFTIWGHALSTQDVNGTTSTSYSKMMIGIDPQGGENALAASVVWSPAVAAMDTYQQFSVQATAQAAQITVFVRNRPDWCVTHNYAFWDDASLTVVSGTGAQPTAQPPTAQPTAAPLSTRATPDANGRIVHIVQPGDSLSYIAWLYGVSIDEIRRLNNLPNTIAVLGAHLVIREGNPPTSTPTPEPEITEVAEQTTPEAAAATSVPAEVPQPAATGTICVMGYQDSNGNGIREAQEGLVAGITFALNDGSQMVGLYTTDGISEPHCFTELPPGMYVVSWTGDNFTPTSDQTWSVDLAAGSILTREFGMRAAGEAEQSASQEGGGVPVWLIALAGALGVVVVLSAVGAGAYLFLIRRARI